MQGLQEEGDYTKWKETDLTQHKSHKTATTKTKKL